MSDLLGYKGKRVIVSGCFSGMGEATARALLDLGAEVHGLDFKASALPLASFNQIDLRDPASIEAGVRSIGGEIDAVFNVSGLPQTFPAEDVVTVNFMGIRYWTECWLPHIRAGGAIATDGSAPITEEVAVAPPLRLRRAGGLRIEWATELILALEAY